MLLAYACFMQAPALHLFGGMGIMSVHVKLLSNYISSSSPMSVYSFHSGLLVVSKMDSLWMNKY